MQLVTKKFIAEIPNLISKKFYQPKNLVDNFVVETPSATIFDNRFQIWLENLDVKRPKQIEVGRPNS